MCDASPVRMNPAYRQCIGCVRSRDYGSPDVYGVSVSMASSFLNRRFAAKVYYFIIRINSFASKFTAFLHVFYRLSRAINVL